MPDDRTYTYRDGEKVELEKEPDQFVVRALPDEVAELGIDDAEQVSSSSSRVTVRRAELEPSMRRASELAPTHHAYRIADTGEEFLITDRIFVTFAEPPAAEQLAEFAGRYGLVQLEEYSSREFLYRLGEHLWKETGREGILTAAYRAAVPIFCPAIADSSIGMGLSQARHNPAWGSSPQ